MLSKVFKCYDRFIMPRIGYARVSSTGQSLEVQLSKLMEAKCDRIYEEKRSSKSANRLEFQSCMNYLREGDTLIVTRLDRLARSVIHLAQLGQRFEEEKIDLIVIDQSIDTSTSTGRLMFNMLASIAEFENDLRSERQAEGIAKAKENGVKFGRPVKLTDNIKEEIYSRRTAGATIGQLSKEYELGEATIYRALNAVKISPPKDIIKTTKLILWLQIENNNKFVRGKSVSRKNIESYYLRDYAAKKESKDSWEYELTFQYKDEPDLERQIEDLTVNMSNEADYRNGFIECHYTEIGTERTWY
jgi:DNA invertase Pin-like site-specific DNA recombinase